MSHYRGPRLKKICRLWALPGLTSKRPRPIVRSELKNQARLGKKSQYRIHLEEKQKLCFRYGLTKRQLLKYVGIARKAKGSTSKFYYNYSKCVWITYFSDWVWLRLSLNLTN